MDAVDGREPTMRSSESSDREHTAVGRRVDLDGSYTGSSLRRPEASDQSPAAEAKGAHDILCDESLLDVTLTPQQDPDTDVSSNGCEDSTNILPENSNMSKENTDGDQCRRTSVPSNTSAVSGSGQQGSEVGVSETSGSCNRSERSDRSEKDTIGTSEKGDSCSSDSDSGTDLHNASSPFGGSSYTLAELTVACEKAAEAMDLEKKREDDVVNAIGRHLTEVSQRTCRFFSTARVPFGDIVTNIENRDLRRSNVPCEEESGVFEKRLDAVKAYVYGVWPETSKQHRRPPFIQTYQNPTATDNGNETDTASCGDYRIRHRYTLRKASNTVRKSRNVVVRQRKTISNLCDWAQRLVSKAELSCQMIHNCMKTAVIVVTPAVRTCRLMEEVVRKLERVGQELPEFSNATSLTAHWTSEALLDAERVMSFHKSATEALQAAWWDLDLIKKYQLYGAEVFRDITAAGDHFLHLVQLSNVSSAKIRTRESNIKQMRAALSPVLSQMKCFRILFQQWSQMCSETLSAVLNILSSATRHSGYAIEGAMKAVEEVFIPADVSL